MMFGMAKGPSTFIAFGGGALLEVDGDHKTVCVFARGGGQELPAAVRAEYGLGAWAVDMHGGSLWFWARASETGEPVQVMSAAVAWLAPGSDF